jgi:hypothetical protein
MEPTEKPQEELNFLKPAISGGVFLGVLATIPFVNLGCCLWLLGGGARAAFLLNRQRPGGLKPGDGALVGVMSGLVGTAVSTILSIPIQTLQYTPAAVAQLREQLTQWSKDFNLPPDFLSQMEPMLTPGFNAMRLVAWAIPFSIVGGLFAMIGGILTVALINRQKI